MRISLYYKNDSWKPSIVSHGLRVTINSDKILVRIMSQFHQTAVVLSC